MFLFWKKIAGRLPMTPQDAVKYYGSRLTEFERAEIEKYSEIWYLGLTAHKIHGEEVSSQNGGYDDENGSYNKVLHDHISYRWVFHRESWRVIFLPLFFNRYCRRLSGEIWGNLKSCNCACSCNFVITLAENLRLKTDVNSHPNLCDGLHKIQKK